MTLAIGQKAPEFCMETTKNLETLEHKAKLTDYLGKWLILFFYPLDFTFVCPTEIRGFNSFPDLIGRGEPYRIECTTLISKYRKKRECK